MVTNCMCIDIARSGLVAEDIPLHVALCCFGANMLERLLSALTAAAGRCCGDFTAYSSDHQQLAARFTVAGEQLAPCSNPHAAFKQEISRHSEMVLAQH